MSEDPLDAIAAQQRGSNVASVVQSLTTLILGLALAFVVLRVMDSSGGDGGQRDDDRYEDRDDRDRDRDRDSQTFDFTGRTILFISEKKDGPLEHDLLVRQMPEFCKDNSCDFRWYDDDEEAFAEVIAWAKEQSVAPPFILVTDDRLDPDKVVPWPDNDNPTTDMLKGLFK